MEQFKIRPYSLHRERNLTYSKFNLPYEVHLEMVDKYVVKFNHLLSNDEFDIVRRAAAWHDTIEDCAITYNDVKKYTSEQIADIVYAVTNELGKNRQERHQKTLPKIKGNKLATYVKLCDRIANTCWSKFVDSGGMIDKYKEEYQEFKNELYLEELKEMFDYLDQLYEFR
jgi:(p)ppGpp synthase/HD superfamily hydrolase